MLNSAKDSLLIIGTGAQAKYAVDTCALQGTLVVGLIQLPEEEEPVNLNGSSILGTIEEFESIYRKHHMPPILIACSKNRLKETITTKLSFCCPHYHNVIHPSAVISSSAILGNGIIINANAVIQPFAKIGNHVMIHAGVIVEHDCKVEDYAKLAPRVALTGYVTVSKAATVYAGAVVAPCVRIGEGSTIGAGSVVLSDVADGVTVMGNPARETSVREIH